MREMMIDFCVVLGVRLPVGCVVVGTGRQQNQFFRLELHPADERATVVTPGDCFVCR